MSRKNARLSVYVVVAAAGLVSTGSAALADVVTDWNAATLDAIRAAKAPPPIASRALAILHAAMYDAINGIERSGDTYFVQSAVAASASKEAAASAAAHQVLVTLFPTAVAQFDARYAAMNASIPDGPRKRDGMTWGESVAAQILLWRASDGWDAVIALPGGSGPGVWIATPPQFVAYQLPQWAFVAPFAMPTGAFFRPAGPPPLNDGRYAADFNEVKMLGAADGSTRTTDQTTAALFWADGSGTETPPGHWNSIARDVGLRRGNTLEQNARLFALLNLAMADAAICAWDAKYSYDFWRPVTAIQNADSDGNGDTVADPFWQPLITTPPFPDYVSGHSAFSGAAATTLARFFGTDDIPFTARSDVMPAELRRFSSFSAAAREAADSRLYAGIHFRSAIEDGLIGGLAIGQWVYERFLVPKKNRSRN